MRLGRPVPWGMTVCGYGPDAPECDRPSTWHILWLADNHTSQACDEHRAFIDRQPDAPEHEVHPFGGDCGMPGTLWHHPYEDEENGYCLFPAVDDLSAIAQAQVPELVTVEPGDSSTGGTS